MKSINDRFWPKVVKTDACWLWTASKNADGYGSFRINGRTVGAHRVSYTLHFGIDPEKLRVCHTCDVPNCVRPDHLFLGTDADNSKDASEKGRLGSSYRARPEPMPLPVPSKAIEPYDRNQAKKLSPSDVLAIRQAYKRGNGGELARQYGVTRQAIQGIVKGTLWRVERKVRKFTANDILKMRHLSVNGISDTEIARLFETTRRYVTKVICKKVWTHL